MNTVCDWSDMDMWDRPPRAARECWGPVVDGLCEAHTRAAGWGSAAGGCGDVVIRDAVTGEVLDYGITPDDWGTIDSVLYGAGWAHPRIIYLPMLTPEDSVAKIQQLIRINADCYGVSASEQDRIEYMTC